MVYSIYSLLKRTGYRLIVETLIKKEFIKCGNNVRIGPGFEGYGMNNIYIGNHVGIGPRCTIMSTIAKTIIGDHVMFGPGVTIVTGGHRFNIPGKYIDEIREGDKQDSDDQDVVFEGDNWVGANATILKGVIVGKGAIIAAGAVVNTNVPAYSICGGVPAHVISNRFKDETELEEHKYLIEKR